MSLLTRGARAAVLALGLAAAGPGFAAPSALDLVFNAPYLSKVETGKSIVYRFERKADDAGLEPSFQDAITLRVGPDGKEDAVVIEMYSGKRAVTMGPMARSGNPVIIALLELDVREMQKVSGGSPYYLRNRLREAVSGDGPAEPVRIDYGGRTIDGWKLTFKPFAADANRDRLKAFADRVYEITFADGVPGGLFAWKTVTPKPGGGGAPLLVEELTLAEAPAETPK